jgi:hypothetical protein
MTESAEKSQERSPKREECRNLPSEGQWCFEVQQYAKNTLG